MAVQHKFQQLNKEQLIQEAERRSGISIRRNIQFEEALEILSDRLLGSNLL